MEEQRITVYTRQKNRKIIFHNLIISIIIFFSILLILSTNWLYNTFGNLTMDEIVFHLKVPMKGANNEFVLDYMKKCLMMAILITSILLLLIRRKNLKEFKIFRNVNNIVKIKYYTIVQVTIVTILFFYSISYVIENTDIADYIKCQLFESKLIEQEYIDPNDVIIDFGDEKRNLIYIYLESIEQSFMSEEDGGLMEIDLIPELTSLAKNNLNFINPDKKVGGAIALPGSTWTVGSMVSQISGLPLKLSIDQNGYGDYDTFLPGAITLGDILESNGYNNFLMIGSDARFAGRDNYFKNHGNYNIYDVNTAIENGKMNEDDREWWGYRDTKLFDWSKDQILYLYSQGKPFNFTMLTADTHFLDGFICDKCENNSDKSQYMNVINCSSKQVNNFVNWLKKQEFFENTTIVIVGDHPTMQPDFPESVNTNYDDSYQKTVYMTIINSDKETENIYNRMYSTMDMFPTTLYSIGADIQGDKLGLGTNLFSEKNTIIEKYGLANVKSELEMVSKFYNSKFIYGE